MFTYGISTCYNRCMEKKVKNSALAKIAADGLPYPSDTDLRRMYDVIQADAKLTHRVAGLGFGNSGDAYRKAAIKLRIMELMNVLRDGKNIRNDIVHKPGYIPSEQSTRRALEEYANADKKITEFLNKAR